MRKKQAKHSIEISVLEQLKRITLICVIGYVVLVGAFYFLAGEQLYLRESRRNIALPAADSAPTELAAGSYIDQHFLVDIDEIESIRVQWGTYYRPNAGTVTMELRNAETGGILTAQSFDAAAITEGSVTTLTQGMPIRGMDLKPLLVFMRKRIDTSDTSIIVLLISTSLQIQDKFILTLFEHQSSNCQEEKRQQHTQEIGIGLRGNAIQNTNSGTFQKMVQGIDLQNEPELLRENGLRVENGRGVHPDHAEHAPQKLCIPEENHCGRQQECDPHAENHQAYKEKKR